MRCLRESPSPNNTMFRFPGKNRRDLKHAGQVFLVVAFLVLLAASNTAQNLYYLVFGGLVSFIVLSWGLCPINLGRLQLRRLAPEAVHRGDSFSVIVHIENHRRLLPAVGVHIENAGPSGDLLGSALSIPAGSAARLSMTERFERRGVYPLPPLKLVSTFPFGLMECRRLLTDSTEIVVYPRVRTIRTGTSLQTAGSGDVPRSPLGEGDEFFSLRDYVTGDDIRHIAWRASARVGSLLVREFQQDAARSVLFVFDSRRNDADERFDDNFEDAIELIASLGVTYLGRHYAVGLLTASGRLAEGEGKSQAVKLLDMLARLHPASPGDRDPLEEACTLGEGAKSVCLPVSSDPARWGRRSPGLGRVLDPREVIHA